MNTNQNAPFGQKRVMLNCCNANESEFGVEKCRKPNFPRISEFLPQIPGFRENWELDIILNVYEQFSVISSRIWWITHDITTWRVRNSTVFVKMFVQNHTLCALFLSDFRGRYLIWKVKLHAFRMWQRVFKFIFSLPEIRVFVVVTRVFFQNPGFLDFSWNYC